MHTNKDFQKKITSRTNSTFLFTGINAYQNNIPMKYQVVVDWQDKTYDFGIIIIGGLLTSKHLSITDILLPINPQLNEINQSIEGYVFESNDLNNFMEGVNIYIVKGYYYPSLDNIQNKTKQFLISNYLYKTVTDNKGYYYITKIPQGLYTLIIEKENFNIDIETFVFAINTQSQPIKFTPVYLIKYLNPNTFAISLEWPNRPQDIDLFVSFELSNNSQCVVGYMNNKCAGVLLKYSNDKGGKKGIEMITINEISNYTYTVYAHKFNRNSQEQLDSYAPGFMTEEEPVSIDDLQLTQSKAKVKIYMPKYKFALLNDEVPTQGEGNYWKIIELTPSKDLELITFYDIITSQMLF